MIIKVDGEALEQIEKRLKQIPKKAPQAVASALNRTVTNVASNVSKETRKKYHIKASEIKENLTKKKANRSNLAAEVRAEGKVLGLDKFKVNPKTVNPKRKQQLKITIKKGNTTRIMGAFIANLSGIKVAQRTGEKHKATRGRYAGQKREKIKRLYSLSVPQMIGNKEVVKVVTEEATKTYEKRLEHEISRLLDKLGG